jgi:hypothetical protein
MRLGISLNIFEYISFAWQASSESCRLSKSLLRIPACTLLLGPILLFGYYWPIYIMQSGVEQFQNEFQACSVWRVAAILVTIVTLIQVPHTCVMVMQILYMTVTLRVSPHGWSIQYWPEHIQKSFVARVLLWRQLQGFSSNVCVHGAKVRFL